MNIKAHFESYKTQTLKSPVHKCCSYKSTLCQNSYHLPKKKKETEKWAEMEWNQFIQMCCLITTAKKKKKKNS